MAIYTIDKLNQDILDKVVEYTVNSVSDIKQKEMEYINKLEYGYDYHINKLNFDFKQSINTLKNHYPKTYDYLISNDLYYQLIMYWYQLTENRLFLSSFFELNQRIYFLTEPSRDYYDWLMIDCRKPYEDPKEYDLILMCYHYDHRMFWVKDGDFIDGLYEIINPKEMLDEYFLHVFSQIGEDYSRFDFSLWAKKI